MKQEVYIPIKSKQDETTITPWNRFYKSILMNRYDKTKRSTR